MKPFYQILCPRAFSLIFAASAGMGLMACNTGTHPGDTNVEGGNKAYDPTKRNETGDNTSSNVKNHYDSLDALQDTARLKNDAYEKSQKTSHTQAQ